MNSGLKHSEDIQKFDVVENGFIRFLNISRVHSWQILSKQIDVKSPL